MTGGHLKNTSIYFSLFIEYLMNVEKYKDELSLGVVKKARRSAPLHDVGKIAIEDSVLRKEGSLDFDEFEQMKMHSILGGNILHSLRKEFLTVNLQRWQSR